MKPINFSFGLFKRNMTAHKAVDEVDVIVQKARKKFERKYKKIPTNEAILELEKILSSKYMAQDYSLSSASTMTAPKLFSSRFERDHFVKGSSTREKLLADIQTVKDLFECCMQQQECAADLMYARFLHVTEGTPKTGEKTPTVERDAQKAETMLCAYLKECKRSGVKYQGEFLRSVFGSFAKTSYGDFLIRYPTSFEAAVRSIVGETKEGPLQHIGWLDDVVRILHGDGEDCVIQRKTIGVYIGVIVEDLPVSPVLAPVSEVSRPGVPVASTKKPEAVLA